MTETGVQPYRTQIVGDLGYYSSTTNFLAVPILHTYPIGTQDDPVINRAILTYFQCRIYKGRAPYTGRRYTIMGPAIPKVPS